MDIGLLRQEFQEKFGHVDSNEEGEGREGTSLRIFSWFLATLKQVEIDSYDDGYEAGVADEIECVKTSGEHAELRATFLSDNKL